MSIWNVERKWKGYEMQFLGLNKSNLMHKINYLLFKQMSMSIHNNTQI